MIEILNPTEHATWNEMLLASHQYSFFHSSEWARVLQDTYQYKPLYFTIKDEGRIKTLLPVMEVESILTGKRGVSLPFSDTSEPMAANNEDFETVFRYALAYGRKRGWKYLELRDESSYLDREQESQLFWGHSLDLSKGSKEIFSGMRESTRRNIKKAAKENVNIEISFSAEAMEQFVQLNSMTRREHGLPPQPHSFFRNVQKNIIEKNMGFIALASFQNWVIASVVFFLLGDKALYKYGASDRTFQNFRANNLVMWHAIQWCCDNGYKTLCFGRTEQDNSGLRQFKAGWGVEERSIRYYHYDLQKNAFVKKMPGISVQKRIVEHLPISVLNAAGTMLYRHMG